MLGETQLQGAKLVQAKLYGANLGGAELQGADLWKAQLQGPDFRGAQLQGADLRGAQLQRADLRETRLWQTVFNAATNLSLADLRDASWRRDNNDTTRLREIIDAFPAGYDWQRDSVARLERLIAQGAQSEDQPVFALDGLLLVDDVEDPRWQRLGRARLTSDERAYDEALVPLHADLASRDPHEYRGLASRVEEFAYKEPVRELGRAVHLARSLLDRAGSALPEDVRERLSRIAAQPASPKPQCSIP